MEDDPYIGTDPRYLVLKRQGYKVLILEKAPVFYKIDEEETVVVYAGICYNSFDREYRIMLLNYPLIH